MNFLGIDWQNAFVPTVSLWELVLRGTIVYLAIFLSFRFILNRQAGGVGISDVLLLVLIADAAQNAMASEYKSITEGAILVGTIMAWNYLFDWLSYHFPAMERLLRPPSLPLVKDGQLLRRNLRKELISVEELMSQVRLQGVEELTEIKQACMESDGHISVIKFEKGGDTQTAPKKAVF